MADKPQDKEGPESFFADWMKTTSALWGSMASMWTEAARAPEKTETSKDSGMSRVQESWEIALKTWQTFASAMSRPDYMATHLQGINALPSILLNVAQKSWDGYFQLHQQWQEKAGKVEESTKAYNLKKLDEDAFKMWLELYEKEFSQVLKIPQVGLTRVYQERMYRIVDKYNIFQATMAQFIHLFYLPVEKSFKVMQEKLSELADEGELPDDSKAYYQMWIKILEGQYMTLFESPEYNQTMHQTLDSLVEFSTAKKEVLQDMLNMFPVPTQHEMDELYKEIYLLKKKVKTLEKDKHKTIKLKP